MTYSEYKRVYVERKQAGALNDTNDPKSKRRNKHAEMYYETRRNSKKEPFVKRVAANTGMREIAVSKIFDHVFIQKHNLWDGYHRFDADYEMAESFRRLSEGKEIQAHDLIMMKHEWLELSLMKRYNYEYERAHRLAERKYNYKNALKSWYERNGIKWSG